MPSPTSGTSRSAGSEHSRFAVVRPVWPAIPVPGILSKLRPVRSRCSSPARSCGPWSPTGSNPLLAHKQTPGGQLKTLRSAAILAAAFGASTPQLPAQSLPTRPEWGVQVTAAFNGGNNFGVGGRVRYPFRLTAPAPISASADLNWFPGTVNTFDLNWNLVYSFVPRRSARPYA